MTVLCKNCSPRNQCTAEKNRTECKYYQQQTNEEWFDTLSTKEKAKVLDLLMDGMSNLRFEIEEILNNDFNMINEEAIEIWLKQQHTNEVEK